MLLGTLRINKWSHHGMVGIAELRAVCCHEAKAKKPTLKLADSPPCVSPSRAAGWSGSRQPG
jgi:hypothetical protein